MGLSKNADYLICVLYKHYEYEIKNGKTKDTARFLGGAKYIYDNYFNEWSIEDISDCCGELSGAGYLDCQYASGLCVECYLTASGIIYIENRFKGKIKSIIDLIAQIKSIIL